VYDLVTIGFVDASDRLPAVLSTLSPDGLLFYEHYLESPPFARVSAIFGVTYRLPSCTTLVTRELRYSSNL